MKLLIQQKIQAGFAVALVFLLLVGVIALWSAEKNTAAFNAVERSNHVIEDFELVLLSVLDMETGGRGYAITGNKDYLKPYYEGITDVDRYLKELRTLMANDPAQLRSLDVIESLIKSKIAAVTDSVNLRQAGDMTGSFNAIASNKDKDLMSQIRLQIAAMDMAEDAQQERRVKEMRKMSQVTVSVVVSGGLLTLMLVGISAVIVRRDLEKRQKAEEAFRDLFENTNDLIQSVQPNGRLQFVNRAWRETLGYSDAEIATLNVFSIVCPDNRDHCQAVFQRLMRGENVGTVEVAFVAKDGRRVELEGNLNSRSENGKVVATRGIFRDVTARRQNEKALRRSEENLSITLRSIGDAVLATDALGRVTLLNPVAEKLTGWTQAEAQGHPASEVFHILNEETRQPIVIPVEKVLATGEVHGLANHTVIIARDGKECPIADSAAPILDNAGRILGVVLVFRDVTEERKVERLIHENEQRLRALNDELEQRVAKRTADLNRTNRTLRMISDCNQVLVHTTTEAELLNKICHIIAEAGNYRLVWVGFAQEDEARTVQPVAKAGIEKDYVESVGITWADAERGRGPTGTSIRTSRTCICKDMQTDPSISPWRNEMLKHGFRSSIALPLTSEGHTFGALTIYAPNPNVFDESETKLLEELAGDLAFGIEALRTRAARERAEEVSRENERFARATLDALTAHVVILDERGVILATNRRWQEFAEQNGIDHSKVGAGVNYFDVCLPAKGQSLDTATQMTQGIREVIAGQKMDFTFEYDSHSPTEKRWFVCRVTRFADGGPVRVVVAHQEITQAKLLEQQQQRTQRLESLGTLAGGIAHDLNNALAPVMMSIEMLREEYPQDPEMLDTLQASTRRAVDMVRQLVAFARGAEGVRIPIRPTHLLKEMQGIMKGTFPKNIQLDVRFDKMLPTVLGDMTQLHQVLLNLCVNARDAMPHGGKLVLAADNKELDALHAASFVDAKPGRYVRFQVTDTGTGMSPETVERIFEPFFTTKGPDKGTGLGLSTVLGIVKGHGGFLHVYSEPGQGSTFEVYLPTENTAGGDTEHLAKPACEFRGHGETILLVDDETSIRDVGRAVLQRLNFTPLTASDGAEGLVQVATHRKELLAIILDMHMPNMDGISFVRAIRRLLPDVRIMAASGRFDETMKNELEALKVTVLLSKPFTEIQLGQALETLLATKQK